MRIEPGEEAPPLAPASTKDDLIKEVPKGVAVLGYAEPPVVHVKAELDDVLREEANQANKNYMPFAYDLEIQPQMLRRYREPTELWDWRQTAALALGDVAGLDLLDLGCGMGEESIYFATLGAWVTAIDISEVGIATLKRRALHCRLPIRAYEMRCDPTSFEDESFDRIHGMGILHHACIEAALAETWRLLRPGGIAVFLEPIGDHAGIEALKRFMMKRRRWLRLRARTTSAHERSLTWDEITQATQRFSRVTTYPFHLTYRLKRFVPERWFDASRRLDSALLTLAPRLQHYAGAAVIRVVK